MEPDRLPGATGEQNSSQLVMAFVPPPPADSTVSPCSVSPERYLPGGYGRLLCTHSLREKKEKKKKERIPGAAKEKKDPQ